MPVSWRAPPWLRCCRASPPGKRRDAEAVERFTRQNGEARGRLLIKGGTVITMDPQIGDFLQADVLVEGKKIVDIKPNIRASATVIDATDMIVIPGLVDGHRHCWQNMFRRAVPNVGIEGYGNFANGLIPSFRPRDVYLANLASGLSAINAGMTCMQDVSHISKTPAHSDAAIMAHIDSGIRGVYGYAAPRSGAGQASQYPQDIHRLKKQFFASDDQLVTMRLAGATVALAREVGVGMTIDAISGLATPPRPGVFRAAPSGDGQEGRTGARRRPDSLHGPQRCSFPIDRRQRRERGALRHVGWAAPRHRQLRVAHTVRAGPWVAAPHGVQHRC